METAVDVSRVLSLFRGRHVTIPAALPAEFLKPDSLTKAENELAAVRNRIRAIAIEIGDLDAAASTPVLGRNAERSERLSARKAALSDERLSLVDRESVLAQDVVTLRQAFRSKVEPALWAAYRAAATRYADALREVQAEAEAFSEVDKALREIGATTKRPIPLPYAAQVEASVRDIARTSDASAA